MSTADIREVPNHLANRIDVGLSQDRDEAYYEFVGTEDQAKILSSHLNAEYGNAEYGSENESDNLESATESRDAEIASLKKELFASKLEVNRLLTEVAKLKKDFGLTFNF